MKNEKVKCMHCDTHIGNKHSNGKYSGFEEYKDSFTLVPTVKGKITKTKVYGVTEVERYGDYRTNVGYIMETQFTCTECSKRTTIQSINSY